MASPNEWSGHLTFGRGSEVQSLDADAPQVAAAATSPTETAAPVTEPVARHADAPDRAVRRGRRPLSRGRRITYRVVASLAAVLLWQLAVTTGALPSAAVASPLAIARVTGPLVADSAFAAAVGATLLSWAEGLAVSVAVAIPVGLLLGTSELAYRMSRFSIDFLRTIPPVALVPLALLLYGATPTMAFVLIVFGSVWLVLLQSMYGVHQVDPAARDVARAYRFRRLDRIRFVVLPSAAPFVATGIRLAATVSLLLAIGAELIGGAPGIGAAINLQQAVGAIPQMWVYIVVSALLGVLVNLALLLLERRLFRWHPAHRPAAAS